MNMSRALSEFSLNLVNLGVPLGVDISDDFDYLLVGAPERLFCLLDKHSHRISYVYLPIHASIRIQGFLL